jgi:HrpA-like RNA helicase
MGVQGLTRYVNHRLEAHVSKQRWTSHPRKRVMLIDGLNVAFRLFEIGPRRVSGALDMLPDYKAFRDNVEWFVTVLRELDIEPIVCIDAVQLSLCKLSEKISRSKRKLEDIVKAEDMLQGLLSADEDVFRRCLLSCAPGITGEFLSVLRKLRIEVLRDLEAGEADVVLVRICRQKFHVDVDGNELDIIGILSNDSDFLLAEGVQAILLDSFELCSGPTSFSFKSGFSEHDGSESQAMGFVLDNPSIRRILNIPDYLAPRVMMRVAFLLGNDYSSQLLENLDVYQKLGLEIYDDTNFEDKLEEVVRYVIALESSAPQDFMKEFSNHSSEINCVLQLCSSMYLRDLDCEIEEEKVDSSELYAPSACKSGDLIVSVKGLQFWTFIEWENESIAVVNSRNTKDLTARQRVSSKKFVRLPQTSSFSPSVGKLCQVIIPGTDYFGRKGLIVSHDDDTCEIWFTSKSPFHCSLSHVSLFDLSASLDSFRNVDDINEIQPGCIVLDVQEQVKGIVFGLVPDTKKALVLFQTEKKFVKKSVQTSSLKISSKKSSNSIRMDDAVLFFCSSGKSQIEKQYRIEKTISAGIGVVSQVHDGKVTLYPCRLKDRSFGVLRHALNVLDYSEELGKKSSHSFALGDRVFHASSNSVGTVFRIDHSTGQLYVIRDHSAVGSEVFSTDAKSLIRADNLGLSRDDWMTFKSDLQANVLPGFVVGPLVFGVSTPPLFLGPERYKFSQWMRSIWDTQNLVLGRPSFISFSRSSGFIPILVKSDPAKIQSFKVLLKSSKFDMSDVPFKTLKKFSDSELGSLQRAVFLILDGDENKTASDLFSSDLNVRDLVAIFSLRIAFQNAQKHRVMNAVVFVTIILIQYFATSRSFTSSSVLRLLDSVQIQGFGIDLQKSGLFMISFANVFLHLFQQITQLMAILGTSHKFSNSDIFDCCIASAVFNQLQDKKFFLDEPSCLFKIENSEQDESLELLNLMFSLVFRPSHSIDAIDEESKEVTDEKKPSVDVSQFDNLERLTIDGFQEEIVGSVRFSKLTVIQGETGCGKSSRVPIMVFEDWKRNKNKCQPLIVTTQPRRMAAVALAKRVASELGEEVGDTVGYAIGHEKCISKNSRIWYVTTGWLLQMLIFHMDFLKSVTHLIIDEIHERSWEVDILCALVKRALFSEGFKDHYKTRLIVMSATVDADMFTEYFCPDSETSAFSDTPVIQILNRTFDVVSYFLDTLFDSKEILMFEDLYGESPPLSERSLSRNKKGKATVSPDLSEDILKLASWICKALCILVMDGHIQQDHENGPAILFFLPGLPEIENMFDIIKQVFGDHPVRDSVEVLALHSSIEDQEKQRVFDVVPQYCTRIILSTNIAETSLTIPNVRYIIDMGLVKQIQFDERSGYSYLSCNWTSKASAKQRAGRAGRTAPGVVFRMYSSDHYHALDDFDTPELLRSSLSSVLLRLKVSFSKYLETKQGSGDNLVSEALISSASQILLSTIQPPTETRLMYSYGELDRVGALKDCETSIHSLSSYDNVPVSSLGKFMSTFAIGLDMSRVLAIDLALGGDVLHFLIIIISFFTIERVLLWPLVKFAKTNEIFYMISSSSKGMYSFDDGMVSDFFMHINLIATYIKLKLKHPASFKRILSESYGVNMKRLSQVCSVIRDTCETLLSVVSEELVHVRSRLSALKNLANTHGHKDLKEENSLFSSALDSLKLTPTSAWRIRAVFAVSNPNKLVCGISSFSEPTPLPDRLSNVTDIYRSITLLCETKRRFFVANNRLMLEFLQSCFPKGFEIEAVDFSTVDIPKAKKKKEKKKSREGSEYESSDDMHCYKVTLQFKESGTFFDVVGTASDSSSPCLACLEQDPPGLLSLKRLFVNGEYSQLPEKEIAVSKHVPEFIFSDIDLKSHRRPLTWHIMEPGLEKLDSKVSPSNSSILTTLSATSRKPSDVYPGGLMTEIPSTSFLTQAQMKKVKKKKKKKQKSSEEKDEEEVDPDIVQPCAYALASALEAEDKSLKKFRSPSMCLIPRNHPMTSVLLILALDLSRSESFLLEHIKKLDSDTLRSIAIVKTQLPAIISADFCQPTVDSKRIANMFASLFSRIHL